TSSHLQSEDLGEIAAVEDPVRRRAFSGQRQPLASPRDQFALVHLAQLEENLGLTVEAPSDSVEHCRDVLAHRRPVRAAAGQIDLAWRREQAGPVPADALHDALGEASLQELDERVDRARAVLADGAPARS